MKIQYLILIGLLLAILPAVSAIQQLSPVQQNTCIQLPQTCQSCTYNNISVVQYPNKTYVLQGQYAMTRVGMSYNYTFCNTSALGEYFVDGHGDVSGVDTGWGGYTFIVNGSGQEVTQEQITLIIIGIVVMLLAVAFFFVLSMLFKHPGTKIFFMSLSTLTLIAIIGIISANADVYLAEFPNIVSIYDKYYIMFIILAGAAMAGLILWLIYYSLRVFNKVRGRTPEDDD